MTARVHVQFLILFLLCALTMAIVVVAIHFQNTFLARLGIAQSVLVISLGSTISTSRKDRQPAFYNPRTGEPFPFPYWLLLPEAVVPIALSFCVFLMTYWLTGIR